MAIAACNIEVRSDGNDLNGGGFKIGGTGTDYAYQNTVLALTDLACASNTTLTSATGGFTAEHVGNLVQIASGTNDVPGWYEITGYTNTNTVTIDRTCATGGNMSDGVGKVGGALATPGQAGKLMNDNAIKGHVCYIKSGTTYTLGSADPNVAGGVVALNANMSTKGCAFVGYYLTRGDMGTAVEIDVGDYAPAAFFALDGAENNHQVICNINVTGKTAASTIGFDGDAVQWDYAIKCSATNCDGSYGFYRLSTISCYATLCAGAGFYGGQLHAYSWAHNNGSFGFDSCAVTVGCVSSLNVGDGFNVSSSRGIAANCIAYKNGTSGTVSGFCCNGSYSATYINCISMANQSYGWENSDQNTLINCAGDGNTSGDLHELAMMNYGFVSVTTSPSYGIFQNVDDSTNWDFRLKTTATEYASLYGKGLSIPGQTDWIDIGAVVRQMRASTFGLTVEILKDGETVDDVVGTYDPITGNYTDPGKANVAEGNDYTFGGVSQTAAYPLTADSQAAQLALDQAAVLAAAASILDSATILSQAGTYHAPEASEVWNTAVFGAASATAGTMGPTDIVVGEGTLAATDIKDGVILDPDGEPLEGTYEGGGGYTYGDADASKVLTTATGAGTYQPVAVTDVREGTAVGVSPAEGTLDLPTEAEVKKGVTFDGETQTGTYKPYQVKGYDF